MRSITYIVLVSLAVAVSALPAKLDLEKEQSLAFSACKNTEDMYMCAAKAGILFHVMTKGDDRAFNMTAIEAQPPRVPSPTDDDCATGSSECGCGWTAWAECATEILECAADCIGTWGAECLECLKIVPGCQDCVCYYACKYDYGGKVPDVLCPSEYADCSN